MKARVWMGAKLLLIAYLAFAILVVAYGESPLFVLGRIIEGSVGSPYGVAQVIYKATPILFCAVSFEITRRAGLFNVGAEGQLMLGALVAALVGAWRESWPPLLGVLVVASAAALAGGALGAFAGWMRARFGAHEVLTTLIGSRLCEALVAYCLAHGAALPGTVRTAALDEGAGLPSLSALSQVFAGTAASLAFVLAVLLVVAVWWAFRRTSVGREISLMGQGPKIAALHGVAVGRLQILAFALAGAAAGLSATALVQGYKGYYEQGLGAGAGFMGMAVALIAKGRPGSMLGAALLVGALEQGGLFSNAYVPRELLTVVIAIALVIASAERWRGGAEVRHV